MSAAPKPFPCSSCPYRRDVPSGVWDADEYAKLPRYDGATGDQPPTAFFCHQQNGRLCSGWVGCHDMPNSLGLRIALLTGAISGDDYRAALDYEPPVELFASGADAAAHGTRDIESPGEDAARVVSKIKRRRQVKS